MRARRGRSCAIARCTSDCVRGRVSCVVVVFCPRWRRASASSRVRNSVSGDVTKQRALLIGLRRILLPVTDQDVVCIDAGSDREGCGPIIPRASENNNDKQRVFNVKDAQTLHSRALLPLNHDVSQFQKLPLTMFYFVYISLIARVSSKDRCSCGSSNSNALRSNLRPRGGRYAFL